VPGCAQKLHRENKETNQNDAKLPESDPICNRANFNSNQIASYVTEQFFRCRHRPAFSVSVTVSVIFYFSVTVIVIVNLIIFFSYFAISVTVTVNFNNTAYNSSLDSFQTPSVNREEAMLLQLSFFIMYATTVNLTCLDIGSSCKCSTV